MIYEDHPTIELIKTRKSSPDWHGLCVLQNLVFAGQIGLDADRDGRRIRAMSAKYKEEAQSIARTYCDLEQKVRALGDRINADLVQQSLKVLSSD